MTADEFPHTLRGKVIEYGKIAGAISAMIVLLGTLWAVTAGPVKDLVTAQIEEAEAVQRLLNDVSELKATTDQQNLQINELNDGLRFVKIAVDEATRPAMIFEVNEQVSGPVDGYCILGQECWIVVRIRRTLEGMGCRVVPGSERFYFVEEESGARIQVTMVAGTPTTEVGRDWFDYKRSFQVPSRLVEPSGFMYQVSYSHCRGPEDTAVIIQESSIIDIDMRTTPPGETP